MGSFKDVCYAIGILADDKEWDLVLAESLSTLSSRKARELFAVMLLFCEIPNPLHLFVKYLDDWVDDLRRQDPSLSERLLQIYARKEIDDELQLRSRKLEDFNIPGVTAEELKDLCSVSKKLCYSSSVFFSR